LFVRALSSVTCYLCRLTRCRWAAEFVGIRT